MSKVETLRHQAVFERISSYCKTFAVSWTTFSITEKQAHSLIKSTRYTINQIDDKIQMITGLPEKSASVLDTINICNMLLWGELEFLAADHDSFGVELGNYARYFEEVFILKNLKVKSKHISRM